VITGHAGHEIGGGHGGVLEFSIRGGGIREEP
jgi:hypothetical protein